MKIKHTPWRVEDVTQIVNSDDNIIATMNFESSDSFSETKDHAAVMVVAPEMLEILQYIVNRVNPKYDTHLANLVESCHKIIKKVS